MSKDSIHRQELAEFYYLTLSHPDKKLIDLLDKPDPKETKNKNRAKKLIEQGASPAKAFFYFFQTGDFTRYNHINKIFLNAGINISIPQYGLTKKAFPETMQTVMSGIAERLIIGSFETQKSLADTKDLIKKMFPTSILNFYLASNQNTEITYLDKLICNHIKTNPDDNKKPDRLATAIKWSLPRTAGHIYNPELDTTIMNTIKDLFQEEKTRSEIAELLIEAGFDSNQCLRIFISSSAPSYPAPPPPTGSSSQQSPATGGKTYGTELDEEINRLIQYGLTKKTPLQDIISGLHNVTNNLNKIVMAFADAYRSTEDPGFTVGDVIINMYFSGITPQEMKLLSWESFTNGQDLNTDYLNLYGCTHLMEFIRLNQNVLEKLEKKYAEQNIPKEAVAPYLIEFMRGEKRDFTSIQNTLVHVFDFSDEEARAQINNSTLSFYQRPALKSSGNNDVDDLVNSIMKNDSDNAKLLITICPELLSPAIKHILENTTTTTEQIVQKCQDAGIPQETLNEAIENAGYTHNIPDSKLAEASASPIANGHFHEETKQH